MDMVNCNPVFFRSHFEVHDKANLIPADLLTKRNSCCIKNEIAKAKFFVPVFDFISPFSVKAKSTSCKELVL